LPSLVFELGQRQPQHAAPQSRRPT
jgi:hypothetical protein